MPTLLPPQGAPTRTLTVSVQYILRIYFVVRFLLFNHCHILLHNKLPSSLFLAFQTSQYPTTIPFLPSWDIEFVNMTADFSLNSTDYLILTYQIGKDRTYIFPLFKDCGGVETGVTNGVVSVSDAKSAGKDSLHDLLTLSYNFNKTAIALSNMWNATGNIQFCQRVQLYAGSYLITEDIREIDIDFDLDVNFNFTNGLGGATTNAATKSTSVDGCITNFKCDGAEFNTSTSPLVRNKKLFLCI